MSQLPGTPMIDTISRSYESGFSLNLNSERRPSVSGSFDETYNSFNTKIGLLQRFTEIESMHPSALEGKVSQKRRKKYIGTGELGKVKEVSPDSGQGDEISIHEYDIEDQNNSAERRPSKQDPELRESYYLCLKTS